MFDLKRPCNNCPFRKDSGHNFQLGRRRLKEIFTSVAFQCHKTVVYDDPDTYEGRPGDKPQQCAGLMSLLHKEGKENQIMQIAVRLIGFDPSKIEGEEVYDSFEEALAAHEW